MGCGKAKPPLPKRQAAVWVAKLLGSLTHSYIDVVYKDVWPWTKRKKNKKLGVIFMDPQGPRRTNFLN